jgi:hypothetical protein
VILSGVKWRTCLVYLDDVVIYSPDRETHLRHVDEALTLLREAGLSLKLAKCHFFKDTVDYLGHVIRPGRLGVAEKNTNALKRATLPRTQTELRSFLGLCNVYRRFVPRFAALAAPQNIYLTKGNPPYWANSRKQRGNSSKRLDRSCCLRRYWHYPAGMVTYGWIWTHPTPSWDVSCCRNSRRAQHFR